MTVPNNEAIIEAFQFIIDACSRLNTAHAVYEGDIHMLTEELDDIEGVCHDMLTLLNGT